MIQETIQAEQQTSEPAKAEPLPPIVEAAFGKEAAAEPKTEEPAKQEPAPEPKTEEPAKQEPAKPEPMPAEIAKFGVKAEKRIRELTAGMKSKDREIEQLRLELGKLKESKTPEAAIERKFMEKEIERAQREQLAASDEIMYERLGEAFPDETERQNFVELSQDFGPAIDKYAPKVSELIVGSEISYKLANAFYNILASEPKALKEFLDMPFAVQRKQLSGLEDFLKQPPGAVAQPPPSSPAAAAIPKSIVPSDSGSQPAATPDPYTSTLERIAEQNRRAYGR